jgi:signal transduction histidine kinase
MPDAAYWAKRIGASWGADAAVALALALGLLTYLGATGRLDWADWTLVSVVILGCSAIVARRHLPVAAAVAFAAGSVMVRAFGQVRLLDGPINLLLLAAFLVAYSLGANSGAAAGLAGVVVLAAGLQAGSPSFNPFLVALAIGPWLAGRVVISRRRLVAQIEARNRDLQAERARYAQELVRYERARIARELHDIVAHCLSVTVVQAGAAQRLIATANRAGAAEALDNIAEATGEAQAEISGLVELLSGTRIPDAGTDLHLIDELVERAIATGLDVHYRNSDGGDGHHLDSITSDVAFRVVQESLTNAIKHSPGAPVDLTIRERDAWIEVEIVSGPGHGASSGLEHTGGGRGLIGMGERVEACGGTFTAGPTSSGGWQVTALLPTISARI